MFFLEEHISPLTKSLPQKTLKLWLEASFFGAIVLVLTYIYYFLSKEGETGKRLFSQLFADAGMIMIGISFGLSGLAYFWNFVKNKMVYRKHIGLIGFYMTLIHVIIALYFGISQTQQEFKSGLDVIAFTLGLATFFTLGIMTLISNSQFILLLGSKTWRLILRTGYFAYLFGVVHIIVKKSELWKVWFKDGFRLPPVSLIISLLAFLVVLLRIALWISLTNKERTRAVVTKSN